MPVVTEDMDRPDGTAPLVEVTIQLADENCRPTHGRTTTKLIMGPVVLRPGDGISETGAWQVTLVGNDSITPAGTTYLVTRRIADRSTPVETCIEVPLAGGPYIASSLEYTPP